MVGGGVCRGLQLVCWEKRTMSWSLKALQFLQGLGINGTLKYTINMKAVWGQKENSEVLFVSERLIRTVNAGCIKYKITWSPKDDRMEEPENIQPRTEAAATCAYLFATTTANPSRFCWIHESIFWIVQTMIIAVCGPMLSLHRLGTFRSLITWGFKLHLQKSWAVKKSINHIVKSIPPPLPAENISTGGILSTMTSSLPLQITWQEKKDCKSIMPRPKLGIATPVYCALLNVRSHKWPSGSRNGAKRLSCLHFPGKKLNIEAV